MSLASHPPLFHCSARVKVTLGEGKGIGSRLKTSFANAFDLDRAHWQRKERQCVMLVLVFLVWLAGLVGSLLLLWRETRPYLLELLFNLQAWLDWRVQPRKRVYSLREVCWLSALSGNRGGRRRLEARLRYAPLAALCLGSGGRSPQLSNISQNCFYGSWALEQRLAQVS